MNIDGSTSTVHVLWVRPSLTVHDASDLLDVRPFMARDRVGFGEHGPLEGLAGPRERSPARPVLGR